MTAILKKVEAREPEAGANRRGFSKRTAVAMALIVAAVVAATDARVRAQAQSAQNPAASSSQNLSKELKLKITAPFTIATVGDIIEPRPIATQDPAYLQLITIIRNADVGFANEESTMVDIPHFPGPFGDIMATPEVGAAIKDMGIQIVNRCTARPNLVPA